MYRPLIITGSFLSLTLALIWLQPKSTQSPLFAPQTAGEPFALADPSERIDIAAVLAHDMDADRAEAVVEGYGVATPSRDGDVILAQGVEVTRLMAFAGVRPVPRPKNGPVVREPVLETPPALQIVPAVDQPPADPTTTVDEAPVLVASAPLPIPPAVTDIDTTPNLSLAGPLFAEIAASRSDLLTVTGIDDEGRLRPTLQSLAQNTQLSPTEAPVVEVSEIRQIAQAQGPEQNAPAAAPSSPAIAARLENSPATSPILGTGLPRTEQSRPVLSARAVEGAAGPTATTLVFGSAEENSALREQLANAPTRAIHTVRLGDSLLTLALRYYGDAQKAEILFEANRRRLSSDGVPRLGQILRIPDIENL